MKKNYYKLSEEHEQRLRDTIVRANRKLEEHQLYGEITLIETKLKVLEGNRVLYPPQETATPSPAVHIPCITS
jgi:hypothetical protein